MPQPKLELTPVFREPRLEMTAGGRLLVRAVSLGSYGLFAAAAIAFPLSDVGGVRALGYLLILFLLHRMTHFGKPEQSLAFLPRAGEVNVSAFLAPASYKLIEHAFGRSRMTGANVRLLLLRRLLERRESVRALEHLDVRPDELRAKLNERLTEAAGARPATPELRNAIAALAIAAFTEAARTRSAAVEPRHFLAALAGNDDPAIQKLWSLFDIRESDLRNAVFFAARPRSRFHAGHRTYRVRHRVMNRAWTARPTPTLDRYSADLTDLARAIGAGAILIGHKSEYDALLDVLSRPGNANALLVGEPGAGKSAIIQHLAYEMAHDRVPKPLIDKRLVSLEIGGLVSGAAEGEMQGRVKKVLDEIMRAGNIVLVIPDLHNLAKTAGAMRVNAADILIPVIKSDAFSVVGTTYPKEFKQYIEPSTEFAGSFEKIAVQELSEDEAVQFLSLQSLGLEDEYKVVISFKAVREAVSLAHKLFRTTLLPQSAEDLLKEAMTEAQRRGAEVVTPEEVQAAAERRTQIPLHKAAGEEREKLLNLEAVIHERYIDQNEAVAAVAKALREYRSGLARKGGTIANFLFVGPTGVGKTELAKLLAELQFGSSKLMLRFDMSEYQTKESLYRLIGSPDGAVRGTLTDAALEHPYALILLDEFEKAHPDILNLFLQVFDDGRLTDSFGRTVNFENTIVIATSNAHSDIVQDAIRRGETATQIADYLKSKLTDFFRLELLNRFTNIIVFRNLEPKDLAPIVRIQLAELAKTLKEQGIEISFDDAVVAQLTKWGYDPQFGARPLRRTIDEKIKSPLADKILRGELSRGSTVTVTLENETVTFR